MWNGERRLLMLCEVCQAFPPCNALATLIAKRLWVGTWTVDSCFKPCAHQLVVYGHQDPMHYKPQLPDHVVGLPDRFRPRGPSHAQIDPSLRTASTGATSSCSLPLFSSLPRPLHDSSHASLTTASRLPKFCAYPCICETRVQLRSGYPQQVVLILC